MKVKVLGYLFLVVFIAACSNPFFPPLKVKESEETFTVIFNSNGGSAVASITGVTSGATITTPISPKKGSYGAFGGWFKDVALNNEWNFSSDVVAEDITLYAKWNAAYAIGGAGPAGGIIFYVDAGGFTVQGYGNPGDIGYFASYTAYYLEAAPVDEPTSAQWGARGTFISGVTTYDDNDDASLIGTLIGNGRKDTYIIANYLNNNTSEEGRGAQLCANKSSNGFNDWFLPSIGELTQLFLIRDAVNNTEGIIEGGFYLSSSQYSSSFAWYRSSDLNAPDIIGKNRDNTDNFLYGFVRAVRAF